METHKVADYNLATVPLDNYLYMLSKVKLDTIIQFF